jgi:hypothetical protein
VFKDAIIGFSLIREPRSTPLPEALGLAGQAPARGSLSYWFYVTTYRSVSGSISHGTLLRSTRSRRMRSGAAVLMGGQSVNPNLRAFESLPK